jgi:hypothetical protein
VLLYSLLEAMAVQSILTAQEVAKLPPIACFSRAANTFASCVAVPNEGLRVLRILRRGRLQRVAPVVCLAPADSCGCMSLMHKAGDVAVSAADPVQGSCRGAGGVDFTTGTYSSCR